MTGCTVNELLNVIDKEAYARFNYLIQITWLIDKGI